MMKPTLVLDLDETLVHSSPRPSPTSSFQIHVRQQDSGRMIPFYVSARPYLSQFLRSMAKVYRIVIFTASRNRYADKVIDRIDSGDYISTRFYRQDCTRGASRGFAKNLSRLSKDLSRVVLVDNSSDSFAFQPNNCILIKSWYGVGEDTELLDIIPFLEILATCDDVRSILSRRIRK